MSGDGDEPRASDDLAAATDSDLLERIEGWSRRARPFVPKIDLYMREQRVLLARRGWRFDNALQIEDREVPYELTRDLMERSPQAKLRDLYRPVMEVGWHQREVLVEPADPAGIRAMAAAKQQQRVERPETVPSLLAAVRDAQERRRAFLREPWQPILRDDEPRKDVVPWGSTEQYSPDE